MSGISTSERLEWARELEQLERLKAKERQGTRTDIEVNLVENFPQSNQEKTRDIVAKAVGFGSGKQYEKAKYIADSLSLLK